MLVEELLKSADFIQATVIVLGYGEYYPNGVDREDEIIYHSEGFPNGAYPLPSDIGSILVESWMLEVDNGNPIMRIYVDAEAADYRAY